MSLFGFAMGKVYSSLIRRPIRNWNIENRAQKQIERQDKPIIAPRHPSTEKILEDFEKGKKLSENNIENKHEITENK